MYEPRLPPGLTWKTHQIQDGIEIAIVMRGEDVVDASATSRVHPEIWMVKEQLAKRVRKAHSDALRTLGITEDKYEAMERACDLVREMGESDDYKRSETNVYAYRWTMKAKAILDVLGRQK